MASEHSVPPAYQIELGESARKSLKKLPVEVRRNLAHEVDKLATTPRGPDSKLTGFPLHKVRAGDYRAVYEIDDESRRVLVVLTGHRANVYERLERLGYKRSR